MSDTKTRKIKVIEANSRLNSVDKENKRKLRVCAYCRVSTDNEEQQSSYQSQVNFYESKINNNRDWELVDIYADEGISAISTKNRTNFNRMIKDCEKGKIDIILTKSISRFSRNSLDCLSYTRKLKELGIDIHFEKEGIKILSSDGELMLTLLSSIAEEESRSISNNIRWAMDKKFQRGEIVVSGAILGYRFNENKELEIVEEEAKTVRLIYKLFLEGLSYAKIARELESRGCKTGKGNTKWSYVTVSHILKNEKYKGDAHLQKTYTRDFMDKKRKKNNGEIKSYYITDSHPAIISKSDFEKVEQEIRRRQIGKKSKKEKASSKYALSDILVCAECETPYRRVTWKGQYEETKYVWRCDSRLKHGKKFCKKSPTIEEKPIQRALMEAIEEISVDYTIEETIGINMAKLKQKAECDEKKIAEEKEYLKDQRELYKKQLDDLILLEINGKDVSEEYKEISKQLKEIQDKLQINSTVNNIELDTRKIIIGEFNEALVKKLIHKVKIISKEEIEIEFVSAVKIRKELN